MLVDGAAWGLVGTKEAGKSTLVHACHLAGTPILTDDVLVLDGLRAFAGPRCIDLRVPTPGATAVRGERHRVTLPPSAAEVPLAGFVHLAWEDGAARMRRLDPGERLARLADGARGDDAWRGDVELLDLAALPGYELRRPRTGDPAAAVAVLLAECASGHVGAPLSKLT